jgi:hypothetical protein
MVKKKKSTRAQKKTTPVQKSVDRFLKRDFEYLVDIEKDIAKVRANLRKFLNQVRILSEEEWRLPHRKRRGGGR